MKNKKQQGYVTFSTDGSFEATPGAASLTARARELSATASQTASDVAYRLARVAEEASAARPVTPNAVDVTNMAEYTAVTFDEASSALHATRTDDAQADARPRALVMTHGKGAKRMVQAALDAGFQVWLPTTADRRFDPHLKAVSGSVVLGERYSDALFCNSFAVLSAARECAASVLLLADEALPLSGVDSFLARADAQGLRVFRPVNPETPTLGWILCSTDKQAPKQDAWRACPHCGLKFDVASLAAGHYTCPTCGGYFRMSSAERIDDLLDAGSFEEWDRVVAETDPLGFPGYADKLEAQRAKSGLEEAVRTGKGRIAGLRVAVGIMESGFFMGSMGSVVGEKVARLIERATDERLPVIVFTASGGARMQEGLISLMQMAKVSCAVSRHGEAGLPYFSVLTDPTTGGVTASFAMQGDVMLAEPGALIGFAGQRVIKDTIKQELPEGFQTAEFALEHGLIDAIVPRGELRATLAHLVALHVPRATEGFHEPGERDLLVDYASVCDNLEHGTDTYNTVTYGMLPVQDVLGDVDAWRTTRRRGVAAFLERLDMRRNRAGKRLVRALEQGGFDAEEGASLMEAPDARGASKPNATKASASAGGKVALADAALGAPVAAAQLDEAAGVSSDSAAAANKAWESVQLARNTHRPTARHYVEAMVEGFIELHGDRAFGDDGAIMAGVGWIGGRAVTVIAQEKGRDLKERIERNFGCPQPEGYRKSLRLMRQAEKFGRPVVCLVDTQGAFCGMEAEERGQGNAIADNLVAMAGLRVPVVSVLVGEGGSGGALALALADRVAMQEHAVYSVLSPEGFASILWKDRTRAPEAAAVMKMSADAAHDMGIVDAVLPEGAGAAHENPDEAAENVRAYVRRTLDELAGVPTESLVSHRRERFARY